MDGRLFDEWYRTEHPKLVRALIVVAGTQAEVVDVVDEAFARAYERWDRVGRMRSPAGWTYRTGLNLLRRRWRRSSMEALLLRRGAVTSSGGAPSADWSVEVWDAVKALSAREPTWRCEMPDLNTALEELGRFASSPLSRHPDLGKVIARANARRRRRRTVLGGALAAVIAGAVFVTVDRVSNDPAGLRTVDDPPTESRGAEDAMLLAGSLISGQFGIGQFDSQSISLVYDQPTALAFNIGDGQVVGQAAQADAGVHPPPPTGPVLVLEGDGVREIAPQAGEELRLHDARVVDGRPTALVAARRGTTPDDNEEELLLVDVDSGDRTSLGVVGGWESGLLQARFAGSYIVTLLSGGAQTFLIVRSSSDGAVVWEAPASIIDASVALTVVDDHLALLEPRFEGVDFEPRLGVSRYDLETGALVSTDTITLDPTSGTAVTGGFCFYAESASGRVICDQSSAGPIEIDLVTGETRAVPGVDEGRVTLPRDEHEPTTTIPVAGEPADRPAIPASAPSISGSQRRAVDAFIRFAKDPSEEAAAAVPFADVLKVGLGAELLRDLDVTTWVNPRSWTLQLEGRWAREGPASAPGLIETNPDLTLTLDRSTSCASESPPAALADLTRLTLTPANIDTCVLWFAVDLYLDDSDSIAAVTIEFWEP